MKTIDVYMCSTTLLHELGHGDHGPWKIYLKLEDIECCKPENEPDGKTYCKPIKVTLSWTY